MRVDNGTQLYDLFLRNAEKLCADGMVEENGTVRFITKSGDTLTSADVIAAVCALKNQRKEANITARETRHSESKRDR